MTIVIKEIVVKTTVESTKKQASVGDLSEELIERLKEEILREVRSIGLRESGRKKR